MSEEQKSKHVAAATPTGKRQLAGSAPTPGGQASAASAAREKSEKPGGGAARYLPEVVAETRKVIWPTGKEMVTYTMVVFAFLIVLSALVAGVDFLAGMGVEKILAP